MAEPEPSQPRRTVPCVAAEGCLAGKAISGDDPVTWREQVKCYQCGEWTWVDAKRCVGCGVWLRAEPGDEEAPA